MGELSIFLVLHFIKAHVPSGITEPNLVHWLRCFESFVFFSFFYFHIFCIINTHFLSTYLFILRFSFALLYIHNTHTHTWILDVR